MTCSVRSTSSNSLNHGRMGWMRVQALGLKVCAGRHVFAQVALGDPGCLDSLVFLFFCSSGHDKGNYRVVKSINSSTKVYC